MACQIGHELDDRYLVHAEVDRKAEEEPNWREHDKDNEEPNHLRCTPVQLPFPYFLQVLLNNILRDDHLLLSGYKNIYELHVLIVNSVQEAPGFSI